MTEMSKRTPAARASRTTHSSRRLTIRTVAGSHWRCSPVARLAVARGKRGGEGDAFRLMSKASQDANRKLRVVADDIVTTGDVSELRGAW
jgi:hypothetical protein